MPLAERTARVIWGSKDDFDEAAARPPAKPQADPRSPHETRSFTIPAPIEPRPTARPKRPLSPPVRPTRAGTPPPQPTPKRIKKPEDAKDLFTRNWRKVSAATLKTDFRDDKNRTRVRDIKAKKAAMAKIPAPLRPTASQTKKNNFLTAIRSIPELERIKKAIIEVYQKNLEAADQTEAESSKARLIIGSIRNRISKLRAEQDPTRSRSVIPGLSKSKLPPRPKSRTSRTATISDPTGRKTPYEPSESQERRDAREIHLRKRTQQELARDHREAERQRVLDARATRPASSRRQPEHTGTRGQPLGKPRRKGEQGEGLWRAYANKY